MSTCACGREHPKQQACKGDAEAIVEAVEKLDGAKLVTLEGGTQVFVSPGKEGKIASTKPFLDEYRTAPERKRGTAKLLSLTSFIDHTNRFKDAQSAIFATTDRDAPSVTSVLDYHEEGEGKPRFGTHRGHYAFPLSEEWIAWMSVTREGYIEQDRFAEFLEEHFDDLMDPNDAGPSALKLAAVAGSYATPGNVLTTARGLKITVSQKMAQVVNTSTGEAQFRFEEEHKSADGATAVRVPGALLLDIPVFRDGAGYQVPFRLRYRATDNRVKWKIEPYRADRIFKHAFDEALKLVEEKTSLPVFLGSPELDAHAPRPRAICHAVATGGHLWSAPRAGERGAVQAAANATARGGEGAARAVGAHRI